MGHVSGSLHIIAHLASSGVGHDARYPACVIALRNTEDILFERGIEICHETVRHWWNMFGPMFADDIRRQRVSRLKGFRQRRRHLDEMFVKINKERHYLWWAVDQEGEVLENFVTTKRDKIAALTSMKKALKRHGGAKKIVKDGMRSYPAAIRKLGYLECHEMGRWPYNPAENSYLPFRRRERAMQRSRKVKALLKFASVHGWFDNHFNQERYFGSDANLGQVARSGDDFAIN